MTDRPAQQPPTGAVPAPPAETGWQGLPCWRLLDTGFNDSHNFFSTWHHWLQDPERPRLLHYVAICPRPPSFDDLLRACVTRPELLPLALSLQTSWYGLLPGFHRFLLADGQLVLTLCVGDAMQSLRQQVFHADEVFLSLGEQSSAGAFDASSGWALKALARCCRRGSLLRARLPADFDAQARQQQWRSCGFVIDAGCNPAQTGNWLEARFDPPWTLKTSRQTGTTALPVLRCAVIGAGLAGASVAASLARRGWQVRVLDAAAAPATGASGLPVGLVLPHTSSDDCPLSRLSRAGVRLMLQQARQHLQEGRQWSASGVLERQIGGTPQLPAHWPPEGLDWSTPGSAAQSDQGSADLGPGLWHPRGAWIKPAELVRAWLNQPGVIFQGQSQVAQLQFDAGVWQLLDASGQLLCSAERVVLANACGARPLLEALELAQPELAQPTQRLPATQGMRGLLSWALHAQTAAHEQAFPEFPVNGYSGLVASVPTDAGNAWFMGSSYQPDTQPERSDADNHGRNFEHLQALLHKLAAQLASTFASEALQSWKGRRCISADRLPLVGPLEDGDAPSLWICAALGSRGLSFSVLCAELLAARMGAEPLPVEAKLAKALDARRG